MTKKVLCLIVLAAFAAGGIFAQEAGRFSVGGRAGMAFGFHSIPNLGVKNLAIIEGVSYEEDNLFNFNFALYGAYSIFDKLSIQAELNFMINQGYTLKALGEEEFFFYSSLDIPILVKYSFFINRVSLGIFTGPYISLPFTKLNYTLVSSNLANPPRETSMYDIEGPGFGLTAGIYGGYKVGPGYILGDLRFNFDLNELSIKTDGTQIDFISRRALVLTIGYEYSF